ncbi:glycosyltransferase family 4 protein [Candidatus Falkowbacteria bacterium]|nr:glycosyltransferase family 4 protein [Candidatus Falkowbacteria bacterium]
MAQIKKSLLVTLAFPPQVGGEQAFYYNVCKNLPPDKIVVLAPQHKNAEEFDRRQNFTIIRKNLLNLFPENSPKNLSGLLKVAGSVRWMSLIKDFNLIAKSHGVELIQAGQILPIGTLALLHKKRKKTPYIFYAHGLDITLPQNFRRKKILLKKIIAEAFAIVANSHFTKDELVKLGAEPGKILVVHPCPNLIGQEPSEYEKEEIIKNHNLTCKKIILTVGRLVERKGHDMVIKSLPKIIKALPEVVYLIVGDGPDRPRLAQLVNRLNLKNYVKFIGPVSAKNLPAYFDLADVFIMPSRQLPNGDVEGFGIVFIEANLFGKPVIGGRSGGVPEAVINGKTGLLVNPHDVEDIAEKTITLLTNQALAAKLGLQGLERAAEEFNWQDQTEKIKEILK